MAARVKKHKERTKRFVINPFGYAVHICLTNDVHQSAAKRHIEAGNGWYALHAHVDNHPMSLFILPFDCGVTTVAHETSHCVWNIMKTIGAEFENEVMAYTHGYITGEICKFMEKHRPGGWKRIGTPKQIDKMSNGH